MRIHFVRSLLLAGGTIFLSAACVAQIGISVRVAPPELPVYEQPMSPGDGYIWTPGYWGWANDDYYWTPGTWVMPPQNGFLWTPGYWGWSGDGFMFNAGYWGPSVGFYGGIDYGFGYFGNGYEGGRWENGRFFYNTSLNRVNADVRNVYNTRVNENVNRVSYNGGGGGINARATAQEEAISRGNHNPAVSAQTQHAWSARNDPQQRFSANHGAPPVTATARASAASHPKDLAPIESPSASRTGNAKLDQKYQKQQATVVATQNQQRQQLQQKQDNEHQQLARQKADPVKTQQLEQRHQQQTQQMQQTHTQQMQQMGQRQQPSGGGESRGGGRR